MSFWKFLTDHGVDVVVDVVGWAVVGAVLSFVFGASLFALCRKHKALPGHAAPRVLTALTWFLVVPLLATASGAIVGVGRAAAHTLQASHLVESAVGLAVHGVVKVVSADARAQPILRGGRVKVDQVPALWALVPGALGDDGRADLDEAIATKAHEQGAGDLLAGLAVAMTHACLAGVSFVADDVTKAYLAPITAGLKDRADGEGTVAVEDIVDVSAQVVVAAQVGPRVSHLLFQTIATQCLPLLVAVALLWALPLVVTALVRRLWHRRVLSATSSPKG